MFTFNKSSGTLRLKGSLFSSSTGNMTIKLADATCHAEDLQFASCGDSQFSANGSKLNLRLTLSDNGAVILQIKNISGKTLRVEEVTLEFAPSTFSPLMQAREYRHMIHSRDFETFSHIKPVHLPSDFSATANPESGMVCVYSHDLTGHALLIGTLPPFGSSFSYISAVHENLHMEGRFGIKVRFEFCQELAPNDEIATSPLIALEGNDGTSLLDQYSELFRSRLNHSPKPAATGWNTWDYYAGAITRQDINENITAIKNDFGKKIKYIVIDEGWECMWGVWQANWKFPEGLEDFCRQVKVDGFTPGIWTAPLMVNFYTPLYRNHPDWFVGSADGNVYLINMSYGTMAQLDITNPEVQHHLRQIYTGLRKCGFEYFKVDFTNQILGAHLFHNPRVGRAQIVRNVFQLIRECIGNDGYLLSCGGPYESVIGIADSYRISADIHNYWGMIAQNIQCMLVRGWMQGTIGNVDPDFLIVRDGETTEDHQLNRRLGVGPRSKGTHWMNGTQMTMEEAKVLALAIHLTGGDMILGDAIGKLNTKGIGLLKKVISPLPSAARPLNLFDPEGTRYPLLLAKTDREYLLGIFNLTDHAATREIDLGLLGDSLPSQAMDFWSDEPVAISHRLKLTLPARSARGLRIPRQESSGL